ncbi:phage tail protein [Rhodopseudomonas palustris]|nr:phage tail protein [Rhodopseudomonas palustris]
MTTLMAYGPVTFSIYPLNPQSTERSTEASYVEKPVVGRRPPLEFMGDGAEDLTISAVLFPMKFGGLSSLSVLDAMRTSGIPHLLVRGDGTPLGWFCVIGAREKATYLDQSGVGQKIDIDLHLKRADAPNAAGYIAALMTLL